MHLVHSTIPHAENDIHFAETQAITDLFHAGHYCTLKAGTLKSGILFACAMNYNIYHFLVASL